MELIEVIHFYIGCQVQEIGGGQGKMFAIGDLGGDPKMPFKALVNCSSNDSYWTNINNIRPILRKLSDMTQEENNELPTNNWGPEILNGYHFVTQGLFNWAIKKQFDLFGLINSNQAIDAKTLQP